MIKHYLKFVLLIAAIFILTILASCSDKSSKEHFLAIKPLPEENLNRPLHHSDRDKLFDQVFGSLVGSAIGDALGAPTEMWERENMKVEYGYIDSLYDMVREPSPEGTWDYNMSAGSTTDDTRWKVLTGEYILAQGESLFLKDGPDPKAFGQHILGIYQNEIESLKQLEGLDPEPYELQMRRLSWLQEWALVAQPFVKDDLQSYVKATNKFYGGEMACAGLLYSPVIGLVYPGAPDQAYKVAYNHSFFDLGYAKDLTALTAAMVARAFVSKNEPNQIMSVHQDTDPNEYFKSRLLGRVAYRLYRDVLYKVTEVHESDLTYDEQVQSMYDFLDSRSQDAPFHAAEIHLINITAMMFCNYDFEKALEFVINYGRDNDTVGAITGSILGALHGYDQIPADWKKIVVQTNKARLGIDLEDLAARITDFMIEHNVVEILD